jgi:predicted amino acid racemase
MQAVSFKGSDLCARYMDQLKSKNSNLIEVAARLHRSGDILANTYVLDMDAHKYNARLISQAARQHGLNLYYMSKQIGRNPLVTQAIINEGFDGVVAVEMQDVRFLHRYGIKISHVGHLVNIPTTEIEYALSTNPEVVTVFSVEKAKQIADVAARRGITQKFLVRPIGPNDLSIPYMEGGFKEEDIASAVKKINTFDGVKVVGVVTFPAILFDMVNTRPFLTPNVATVQRVAEKLRSQGIEVEQVNLPSNNHSKTMKMIADAGATHVEPGSGVTGFSASQIYDGAPETPAFVYVSEVSHFIDNWVYIYGGGFGYIDVWGIFYDNGITNPDKSKFQFPTFVGSTPQTIKDNVVQGEVFQGILDYHARLYRGTGKAEIGDTVLCGFRPQFFLTRAMVAVVSGLRDNNPRLLGIFDHANNLVDKHGHLLGERPVIDMLQSV